MAEITYGETVASTDITHYIVQAKWPKSEFGSPDKHLPDDHPQVRWGGYSPGAWNDRVNPNTKCNGFGSIRGNFEEIHSDVANHPSRVTDRFGKKEEMPPTFTAPEAALAYASRLAEHGEVAARFSQGGTQQSRDLQYANRPIRTRVVEKRLACIERIVSPHA